MSVYFISYVISRSLQWSPFLVIIKASVCVLKYDVLDLTGAHHSANMHQKANEHTLLLPLSLQLHLYCIH